MLDTDLLRSFLAVADTGSFTRAGQVVGRTQAAISMQIKKLEERVGHALLDRRGRGVSLTIHGERLVPYARQILHLGATALEELGADHSPRTLRFGIPDDFVSCFLPRILDGIEVAFPGVVFEIVCQQSSTLVRRLKEGEVDVALVSVANGGNDDRIVRTEPLVWITSGLHRAHHQEVLPLALFNPGCSLRDRLLRFMDREGRSYRIAYSSASHIGLASVVRTGLAVSAVMASTRPTDLKVLGPDEGFPDLGDTSLAVEVPASASALALAMADHVATALRD